MPIYNTNSIEVESNIRDYIAQLEARRNYAQQRLSMRASVFTVVPYAREVEWRPDNMGNLPQRGAMFRKATWSTEWYFQERAKTVNFMNPQSMADCLNDVALYLCEQIKDFTPVLTGNLQSSMTLRLAKA